ncbi:acyl dehydratase [Crossiella equi]|uniref:Acyl dehydratase n=1 Tax=Crossiella equi TaxID=130796 RepID=A0ABS5ANC6_9PSEU|nr:MaoC/PaaZ C-terminal domain-containing protein [Crossiella equi]MBP2478084.1 acyl dehydratase [Crossiella equi]
MPINPELATGAELPPVEFSWTATDVLLYHLSLGAGARPTDPRELRYTYEPQLHVLPTFALVAPGFHRATPPEVRFPGVDIDLGRCLHGEQSITLRRPLPVAGTARLSTRIVAVHDKGRDAVLVQESTADLDDDPLFTARSTVFARGEGGFGGDRGPSTRQAAPDRAADHVLTVPTLPQQALLYRLCGDRNPLHADPAFAAAAGFPMPILHGLCTYGMVAKAVTDHLLDGDPGRLTGIGARFTGVVLPGEELVVHLWHTPPTWTFTASTASAQALVGSVTAR